jgi:hypothetical protein
VSAWVGIVRGRALPSVAPWWAVPLVIALASRAFSLGWLAMGLGVTPDAPFRQEGLTLLDGRWYLSIAASGYHAAGVPGPNGTFHDFAFFPGWPALVALLTRALPVAPDVAAPILSNLLACLAMVAIWRVGAARWGPRSATRGLALFAFSPAAYVLSVAYSEALFLLVAALAIAAPAASGGRVALTALAQTVRLPGFAIGVTGLATLRRAPGRSLALLAVGPVVFGLWCVAIAWLTGDPLGYLRGTPSWWAAMGVGSGPLSLRPALDDALVQGRLVALVSPIAALSVLAILVVASVALLRLREHRDLGAYCLAAILPTLLLAHWEQWPRHALLAFPAFLWLGDRLDDRARTAMILLFGAVQVLFVLQVTHRALTP